MAISARLKALLDAQHVKYTAQSHPTVYTAQEIAAAAHVPGRQLAKCVLVKTEKGVAVAVLPAIFRVDLKKVKALLKAKTLRLASESEIKQAFPDVEVGAMSPFGNLYNIPVIADKSLAEAEEIACNAGTHTETVTLRYRDFERLAKPRLGTFAQGIARSRPSSKPKTSTKTQAARRPSKRSCKPATRKAPHR